MEQTHSPRLVKWSLIVAIVIVVNLFFNYAISLLYQAPQYNDYFPPAQIVNTIDTQNGCLAVGGQWTAPVTKDDKGYCNPDFTKQQQFQTAQKQYDEAVFVLLVLLGIASIIVGALFDHEVLSPAFSWAGALSLFIASVRYWSDANNVVKVLILFAALGALVWIAIKKFK